MLGQINQSFYYLSLISEVKFVFVILNSGIMKLVVIPLKAKPASIVLASLNWVLKANSKPGIEAIKQSKNTKRNND